MSFTTWDDWTPIYPCDVDTPPPERVAACRLLAQRMLWAAGGRRHGTATTEDEAYRIPSSGSTCGGPWMDRDRAWHNAGLNGHTCCAIRLHHQPVISIEAVRVDGVALDPASFALEGGTLMRRGECWPVVADCDAPIVVVDYRWGIRVDADAALAHGEVTCELLIGLDKGACRISSRVVNRARQGVTETFDGIEALLKNGRIGTPIADAWIGSVNPAGLRQQSRVFSPDVPRRV